MNAFTLAGAGLTVVLSALTPLLATHPAPTFSKDVAPDTSGKVPAVSSAELNRPDVGHQLSGRATVGARHQGVRRQQTNAPVAIDPSVGVRKFKNDMSLSQSQIDTIVAWVDGGAPQGNPTDVPPPEPLDDEYGWKAERDGYGAPDLAIRSPSYTMPARGRSSVM